MTNAAFGRPVILALLAINGGCAQNVVVGVDPGSGDSGTSQLTGSQTGMVVVRSPGGVAYSIDGTEVSQKAYALFLQSNPQPDPTSATCGWKTTHVPGSEPSDANQLEGDPTECHPTNQNYDPIAHGDDPVVCVDWCDAAAYCAWAGKRLCGHIGGGPATDDDFDDASTDQWFNACSNGGTTQLPYGSTYLGAVCNDSGVVAPVGTTAGCHGTTAPFTGVFDMSGNVAEWEDNCQVNVFDQDGGVPSARCMFRGGSFDDDYQALACAQQNIGDSRNMARPRTGIRCCAD